MNVLITSASRKVTLVKYFQRALVEEGGGKVIAVDINPLSPALYFADEHFLVPRSDAPGFMDAVMRLCREYSVSLLIPTRDEELPLFASRKKEFHALGTVVMVGEPQSVAICQDKKSFAKFCDEKGLETPRLIEPSAVSAEKFPLILKPRFGKGSKGIARVDSLEDFEYHLQRTQDPVIQEYVDAPEYTIDLFADFKGWILSVVPRQRVIIFGGESFVTKTSNNPLIIDQTSRLAQELKLIGHNTIQCFFDGKAVKFIEVNPRYGGAARASFAAGAPTPLFLVRLLRGEEVQPIGTFRDGYIMLRFTDDMFVSEAELARNRYV